jgi:dienelactone hydrolase
VTDEYHIAYRAKNKIIEGLEEARMAKPYLGAIGPFLEALAEEHPRKLAFGEVGAQMGSEVWQAEARKALWEHMAFSPTPVPFDATTVATEACDGYVRETVEFASSRHHRLRCEVLIPEGDGPFPGMVALHDHGGFFTHGREKLVEGMSDDSVLLQFVGRSYEGRFWASELARRGYVVIVNDAHMWGERRVPDAELPDHVRKKLEGLETGTSEWANVINHCVGEMTKGINQMVNWAGMSWMGLVLWDDRRTFEYLRSRQEVDGARIACGGLSGGGWRSTYLFGAEEGIAAGAIAGWMSRLGDQVLHDHQSHIGLYTSPDVYRHLDLPDIAAIGAPKPLLVLQCEQDRLFTMDSMKGACEDIQRVYDAWGASGKFEARFYDVPHCLNVKMQEEMFSWLEEQTG